jgi:hypothetical protein
MTAGVYEELASGEKRKVIYKNGRYWITSPMTPQTVKINLNEGENRKNVYQQMMTAVNWQGTYDDFVKYINDKLSVVKSVSTKQESISKEDNTSGSVADRWKNKYKR